MLGQFGLPRPIPLMAIFGLLFLARLPPLKSLLFHLFLLHFPKRSVVIHLSLAQFEAKLGPVLVSCHFKLLEGHFSSG